MSLSQIKSKIKSFESTKKVTKAMRNIASVKITILKHRILLVNSNVLHLKENIGELNNKEMDNKISIVFSPKKGMCGGLSRRILADLTSDSTADSKFGGNSVIVGVELPVSKLLSEFGYTVESCFIDLEDDNYPVLSLFNSIKEKLNTTVELFFVSIANNQLTLQSIQINLDGTNTSKVVLYSYLEYAYLHTRLTEEQKRVEAMQLASDNCDKLLTINKTKYFKLRQAKITQEILEISN